MLHFASKAEIRFRSETKRRNSGRRLHSTGMFVLAALVKLQRFTQRLFERRANVLYRIEISDIEMFNDVLNNFKKKAWPPFRLQFRLARFVAMTYLFWTV